MTLSGRACHPELVEGSRADALPTMLRQAQHDPIFNYVMGSDSEESFTASMTAIQGEEDVSLSLNMTKNKLCIHSVIEYLR